MYVLQMGDVVANGPVVIDSIRNDDWMKALPGYKAEVSSIKAALAKLSEVSKQTFRITLGSKS